MADLKYIDITEKFFGSAMRVNAGSGNGFQEVIYHRILEIEF